MPNTIWQRGTQKLSVIVLEKKNTESFIYITRVCKKKKKNGFPWSWYGQKRHLKNKNKFTTLGRSIDDRKRLGIIRPTWDGHSNIRLSREFYGFKIGSNHIFFFLIWSRRRYVLSDVWKIRWGRKRNSPFYRERFKRGFKPGIIRAQSNEYANTRTYRERLCLSSKRR